MKFNSGVATVVLAALADSALSSNIGRDAPADIEA